jgi:hypothetical protein
MSEVTNGPSSGGNPPNRRGWRLPEDGAPGGPPGFPGPGRGEQRLRGAPPPWQAASAQPSTLPGSVSGLARAVNPTTVQNPNGTSTTVVTFRLEQYDARAGRTGVLTVRLFEENALGFVNEGDWVEVTGKLKHGFLKADKAVNHTSQAQYSRSAHRAAKIIGAIAFCLVLMFILGIGVSILLSVLHSQ